MIGLLNVIYDSDYRFHSIAFDTLDITESSGIDMYLKAKDLLKTLILCKCNISYVIDLNIAIAYLRALLIKEKFKISQSGHNLSENTFYELWAGEGSIMAVKIRFKKRLIEIRNLKSLYALNYAEMCRICHIKYIDIDKYLPNDKKPNRRIIELYTATTFFIMRELLKTVDKDKPPYSIGSMVYAEYKATYKNPFSFDALFPQLPIDMEKTIRQAYKAGICFSPNSNEICENIISYDRNSAYLHALAFEPLPYGEPHRFQGVPPTHKLWIGHVKLNVKLKENCLPVLTKKNAIFDGTDLIVSTKFHMLDTWITSIDLSTIIESYQIFDIEFFGGFWFDSSVSLFKDFVMPIYERKARACGIERFIEKSKLNSFQGKFSTRREIYNRIPTIKGNKLEFKLLCETRRQSAYLPVACFVTAYGRQALARAYNSNDAVYADTDSIHIRAYNVPHNIIVSDTDIGAWKVEHKFKRVKYIGQKQYIGEVISGDMWRQYPELYVNLAGFPRSSRFSLCDFDSVIKECKLPYKRWTADINGGIVKQELYSLRPCESEQTIFDYWLEKFY